ncbi:hypothetical protein RDABS01_016681 [Bienertia sinuspersici]
MKTSTTITLIYPSLLSFAAIFITSLAAKSAITPERLLKGFTASPNPTVTDFQPLLSDSTGNFSLSFIRVNSDRLALGVVHIPSGESLWRAKMGGLARWGDPTKLVFNGSLVIGDYDSGVFWSTKTDGDRAVLASSSNLRVLNGEKSPTHLWQSFDFPSDTLVENQNFTSAMSLTSLNGLYTMRLGPDFVGLYAKFKSTSSGPDQNYYKRRALEARKDIIEGAGPILVRISSDGYMGIYQNGSTPADVETFNSYRRSIPGPRRVRIENDGNLKAYYWSRSSWVLDYKAITETCELPSSCGPYGLCRPGAGCSCLNNQTDAQNKECYLTQEVGDLCARGSKKFSELRRTGVEPPFKELMAHIETTSYEECEKSCLMNCTCWGVLYNNASKFCYNVDYPIQTILEVGHENKMGYFKILEGAKKKKDRRLGIGIGLLCGAFVVIGLVIGFGVYKICNKKKRATNRILEEENIYTSGHYKDLGSSSSGSIELSSR